MERGVPADDDGKKSHRQHLFENVDYGDSTCVLGRLNTKAVHVFGNAEDKGNTVPVFSVR